MFKRKDPAESIHLVVDDMRCSQCEATIKIALQKVPGVKRVRIQHRRDVFVTLVDGSTDIREQLVAAIEASGYSVFPDKQ